MWRWILPDKDDLAQEQNQGDFHKLFTPVNQDIVETIKDLDMQKEMKRIKNKA
jgi:hypothetical protein